MEYATSKQLWKLQSLAAERAVLMFATQSEGEPLTEVYLPITKDGASAMIKTMIETNRTLELLKNVKQTNVANKVYGEQDA